MGSPSSLRTDDQFEADDQFGAGDQSGADDHSLRTLDRLPPVRMGTGDLRPGPRRDPVLLGTSSFYGDSAYDVAGKLLGEIEELILDIHSGRVAYALMSVGSLLGTGRKMVAIPWSTVTVDRTYQRCIINIDLERLREAPSLGGDLLLRMADTRWATEVHTYFDCKPYWE